MSNKTKNKSQNSTPDHIPLIALMGRANVGKSTLFNRLTESREALTSNIAWTTRDRKYGICLWKGEPFNIVDTGGILIKYQQDAIAFHQELLAQIKKQTEYAAKEAQLICQVVDYTTGLLNDDFMIAQWLKKYKIPVLLIVNKCDKESRIDPLVINSFAKLGLGKPILISALNGSGTGDFLDIVHQQLYEQKISTLKEDKTIEPEKINPEIKSKDLSPIKVIFIGKPNVGKSSLVNTILRKERMIVDSVAYTTREIQDIEFMYQNQRIVLIDTVGMRKKTTVGIEHVGVKKSVNRLHESDIALITLDATNLFAVQDKYLLQLAQKSCKGWIVIINKYDLITDKQPNTLNVLESQVRRYFPYAKAMPIIFVSALDKYGIKNLLDLILKVKNNYTKTVSDEELRDILKANPGVLGKDVKVKQFTQLHSRPPAFLLVSRPRIVPAVHDILVKRIREKFNLLGVSVELIYKKP